MSTKTTVGGGKEVKRVFQNLKAEMARNNVTVSDFARLLNKTERSVRDKINGKGDFTWSEITAIRSKFFPDLGIEYLFERAA